MSHYTKCKTKISDQQALLKALASAFGWTNVEVHKTPQSLFGYQGDIRPERAEVIVRRQNISAASNDLGFQLAPDGTYQAIISEYDQGILGPDFLRTLSQTYSENIVRQELVQNQDFEVVERSENKQTKEIRLVLRRKH